ncbi:hypothetical protein Ccar_15770 [Clostridium carboxidivorans P7]|uniref:Right handed beta helix domain-containing protein n=1 Tax=Clostridium carboxidivorans P7 TaxID=536227 RepID=C6Q0Z4_9CLOT|nr:hypothetical protein [Clostridium carboxidivorans]AKN32239.1 hypothetical protein Ccar_15770 [Clostridium carboxidivorans P7]EET84839.1 hypothetical protein CcarbDRAFT_4711 [Clostridium carboxidivorans P7]
MERQIKDNVVNELLILDEKVNYENNIILQVLLKGETLNLDKNSIKVTVDKNKGLYCEENEECYSLNIKFKYINKKIKIVSNGEELQKALDDKTVQNIFLQSGEYKLTNGPITISLKDKVIIGNEETIFTNGIIIKADTCLKGIKFISESSIINNNCYIYVCKFSNVILENVDIQGNNFKDLNGIILEKNSMSKISIINSSMSNLSVGIQVNEDNVLGEIKNNKFNNVKFGISNLKKGAAIEDIDKIINNTFSMKENGEDISFSSGVNIGKGDNVKIVTNGVSFARKLSLNNNYAFVKGEGMFSDIETKFFQVSNDEELNEVLKSSNNGYIIRLINGKYYGNICIDKEIALVGESKENVFIVPNENYNKNVFQYGISINSSNVLIKNLTIDGKKNSKLDNEVCHFRDGIRYGEDIPSNNELKEICIKNISRRGISIWPETVVNTNIENCNIENIESQQGIYMNGSGEIKNCIIKNSRIGIEVNNKIKNGAVLIENNFICKNERGILIYSKEKDPESKNINLKNNFFENNLFQIDYKL